MLLGAIHSSSVLRNINEVNNMKTILATTMALFLGLTLSEPALARGGGGGGGGGFHGGGGGGGFHGGGGGGRVAASGGGFHSMGGHGGGYYSGGHSVSSFGGRSFATAPSRTFSPTVRSAQTAGFQRGQFTQRSQFAGTTARSNQLAGRTARTNQFRSSNNSIAFGGHGNFAGANTARVPNDVSRGWDHGHTHDWNHHHWGFRNGGWFILDDGYYGYPYYGYGWNGGGYYDTPYGYAYSDAADDGSGYAQQPAPTGDSLATDVQAALNQQGYDAGPADGDVGPQTRNAIAAFQQDHGLTPTGRINSALLSALKID